MAAYGAAEVKNVNKYAEKDRIRAREYYYAHRSDPEFKKKVLERRRKMTAEGYDRAWRLIRKTRTLTHYGGGKCACVKCGFRDVRALSIDHINGGGTEDRKSDPKLVGQSVYYYLHKYGYPSGYQTLCMNCQFIKRVENNEVNSWPKYGSGGKKRVEV